MIHTIGSWVPRHDVLFYESDNFLVQSVVSFLAEGIRAGQPVIVVATPEHRRAFVDGLRRQNISFDDLIPGRDVLFLDAEETLSAFMEGGRINRELFEATVGNVFESVIERRRYAIVRAYGEMVDMLCKQGKGTAAIALEELWNGLSRKYAFSLLCGYHETSLSSGGELNCVTDICKAHMTVLPIESEGLRARLGLSA